MKNTLGIIISFDNEDDMRELAEHRPVSSIPFGGRYRVIDFMLSNFVNSGCHQVGILMRDKYRSLMDHLGSGKDWDLARKRGGMMLLPPNAFAPKSSPLVTENYHTWLEALGSISDMLTKNKSEYVFIAGGDIIANVPLDHVLKKHKECGADISVVCIKNGGTEGTVNDTYIELSPRHEVVDLRYADNQGGKCKYKSLGIYLMKRKLLLELLSECVTHNMHHFERDSIHHLFMQGKKIHGYVFDQYAVRVETVKGYFASSMDMLDKEIRDQVFLPERPILTKIRDEAPTYYGDEAVVNDSLIADGCTIEGTVENSILFSGVHVEKGAVVKDSIVMSGGKIGKDVELSYVVADKGVQIRQDRRLMGHATYPVAIAKDAIV